MRWLSSFVFIAFMVGSLSLARADMDMQRKITLQTALLEFLDDRQEGGRYVIFNPTQGELLPLAPSSLHPKIVPFRNGYFLCADFLADDGTSHEVDFLAMPVGDGFQITQTLFDARDAIRRIAGK